MKYKHISEEKFGILYYTGRILPTQGISQKDSTMCDVCLDLIKSSFCVPIVDALSPIAYSIADEVHWYHPDVQHGGIESALRETSRIAFIIGGRELLKTMKHACARCRFLYKQEIKQPLLGFCTYIIHISSDNCIIYGRKKKHD